MHVVTAIPTGLDTTPGLISQVLDPLRMPLFFLVSGLFSHRILERTLSDLWFRRLWFLLVPYLVFSPLQAYLRIQMETEPTVRAVLKAVIVGDPGLWFLHALIVYNLAAWALKNLPRWMAVVMSTIPLIVVCLSGLATIQGLRQASMYATIFFVGLHYRKFFFAIASRANDARVILGSLILFITVEAGYQILLVHEWDGWDETIAAQSGMYGLLRTLTAVPIGIIFAVWLTKIPAVRPVILFVGKNTLPIYVSHQAILVFVYEVVLRKLYEANPDKYGILLDDYPKILIGLLTCVLAGSIMWLVGRTPVLKWVLYPPPLRRQRRPVLTRPSDWRRGVPERVIDSPAKTRA